MAPHLAGLAHALPGASERSSRESSAWLTPFLSLCTHPHPTLGITRLYLLTSLTQGLRWALLGDGVGEGVWSLWHAEVSLAHSLSSVFWLQPELPVVMPSAKLVADF